MTDILLFEKCINVTKKHAAICRYLILADIEEILISSYSGRERELSRFINELGLYIYRNNDMMIKEIVQKTKKLGFEVLVARGRDDILVPTN